LPAESAPPLDEEPQGDPQEEPAHARTVFERIKQPQISTKKSAHQSSVFLAGLEIAVRVNHVDPLNNGRRNVKSNWVADGENAAVDLESVIKRKSLPHDMAIELQGPALSAKADGESLPLKARFLGVGVSKQFLSEMPHDDTPPRVEVKVEVKLTDKSIGSLAALAGASQELHQFTAELAITPVAQTLSDLLTAAVPIVSGVVAAVSVRRAVKTLKDPESPASTRTLAVLRALADITTVFLPLAGTLANVALVGAAVFSARRSAKQAAAMATTGPPVAGATGGDKP
jgi:hypothetical protein